VPSGFVAARRVPLAHARLDWQVLCKIRCANAVELRVSQRHRTSPTGTTTSRRRRRAAQVTTTRKWCRWSLQGMCCANEIDFVPELIAPLVLIAATQGFYTTNLHHQRRAQVKYYPCLCCSRVRNGVRSNPAASS
jgi:hypothetical protein